MGEIASRYVSIYPRIATGFSAEINAAVGKGAAQAGKSAGKSVGDGIDQGVKQSAPRVGAAFKSVVTGALVLGGVRAVSSFVSETVSAFNAFEDAASASEVVFGSAVSKISAMAEGAAKNMGISKTEATEAAITFGAFGKSAGLAGDDLAGFSAEMVQLAGDMASFRGTSADQAIQAIGAAFRGETEPIRAYQVMLDDATLRQEAFKMGLISSVKEGLTPQQKVLAAHAQILAQTKDMQGDYNRTAEQGGNVQKTLQKQSADLAVEIGEKLQPAMIAAQKAGIGLIEWTMQNQELLIPLAKAFGIAAAAIGGFVAVSKGIEALKSARETIKGIGDAFQAMGTKAKIATASAGAVGLALTAAAVVYGVFAQRNAEAEARVEDFTAALEADTGALGQNTRAAVINALEKQGLLEQGRAMGIAEKDLTDAVMGSADAMERVSAAARAAEKDLGGNIQGQALARGETEKFIGAIQGQNSELNAAIEANKRVTAAMGDTDAETKAVTTSITDGKLAYEDYTKAINGSYNAQLKLAGSERAAEAAIDEGAERIKEWTAELTKKYEEEIKADAAAKGRKISDEEAGKQAEKRAKKEVDAAIAAGEALDINTEAGRRNEEALHAIADTTLAAMAGMTDLEKANGQATERAQRGREEFMKLAEELGVSADEAQALADKLGLIKPETIDWKINLKFAGPSRVKIGDKYINVGVAGYADGGPIRGGVPGRDSVPALLMPGEHVLTADEVRRMGGHAGVFRMRAAAGRGLMRFASGGPVMPSYKGHSLDWWEDHLLSDLEYTRLQIRIKDLKADLEERETYKVKGKKKKRYKLRDLERTEAQLELADAQERLRLATEAQQANRSAAGSISDQIGRYQSDLATWESRVEAGRAVYDNAAAIWQQAAQSLGKSAGLGSLDPESVRRSNAVGDVWWEKRDLTAADLARRVSENASQVETFISLLDELRRAGASEALISDVMALGTVEGTKAARMYLADRSSMAIAESGYARLASSQQRLSAIGSEVGAINVTVNEAATPEATKQAVLAAILAART